MVIKHKHASHVIIIEGHAFKANDAGQWDLTDIWQTLTLHKGKAPSRWRNEDAKDLREAGDLCIQKMDAQTGKQREATFGTKLATIEYAAWVSREFKRVVFHAFEAILEMPEVALLVADKMTQLGHSHSASILERMTENQERNAALRMLNRSRKARPLSPAEKEHKRLAQHAYREARKERQQAR